MAFTTTVYNTATGYKFVVVEDGVTYFEGVWGKDLGGMTESEYLQKYKAEAELLASEEKTRQNPPEATVLPI